MADFFAAKHKIQEEEDDGVKLVGGGGHGEAKDDDPLLASDSALPALDSALVSKMNVQEDALAPSGTGRSELSALDTTTTASSATSFSTVGDGVKRGPSTTVDMPAMLHRLNNGIPVLKHGSDGRVRERTLYLAADGGSVGWREGRKPDHFVPVRDIVEVRAATELDPQSMEGDEGLPDDKWGDKRTKKRAPPKKTLRGVAGTPTLRKTCKLDLARVKKAFSFILDHRTLDFECRSETEAKMLVAALKVLVACPKHPGAVSVNCTKIAAGEVQTFVLSDGGHQPAAPIA